MNTSEYPRYRCPFAAFNVAQAAVVPFLDQDVNLVVTMPTAAGKTALAECAFGYHLALDDCSTVVYVSPYKSISAERYRTWMEDDQFSKHGILLDTGDTSPTSQQFCESRLVITTSESLDFKLSRHESRMWMSGMSCVVFDEAHFIGEQRRGPCMESAVMSVAKASPNARFIMLSATVSNPMQMAKWLKTLNGKVTKCVRSDWRPVKLKYRFHEYGSTDHRARLVVDVVKKKEAGEKVLVFVQSKKLGRELVAALSKVGVRSAFHNASLSAKKREKLETLFDDTNSHFDVIVSTSTLSAGVNLGG